MIDHVFCKFRKSSVLDPESTLTGRRPLDTWYIVMKRLFLLLFLITSSFAATSQAAIAVFDILGANGTAFDGSAVGGQLTADIGVVLTTTALAPSGTISINGSGMGINATGAGDAASAFDDDNGAESWSFSFDTEIVSLTLDLNALSGTESFELSSPAFTTMTLIDGTPNDIFTINESVSSGTPITLTVVDPGTEAALVALSVNTIPEPSSTFLAMLGLTALGLSRRRG